MRKRRIKAAKIDFISLCPRGKNNLPAIYKSDGSIVLDSIVKMSPDFEEKGELTAIVYPAEFRDAEGDIASSNVIKEFAYDYMRSGGNIDIRHNGKAVTKDQAFVAENFIIQKNDPRFTDIKDYGGNSVDPTGSWGVVIKIDDPELRSLYKEDGWQGVSMFGHAVVESENLDKELFDMDKEELKKMLEGFGEALVTNITKALKPEPSDQKPPENDANAAPIFKGDSADTKAVERHLKALEKYELSKGVDFSDLESVKAYTDLLKEDEENKPAEKEENKPAEGEEEKKETETEATIKEYKKKIADLEKSSNQPAKDENVLPQGISKEDNELISQGHRMAEWVNKKNNPIANVAN